MSSSVSSARDGALAALAAEAARFAPHPPLAAPVLRQIPKTPGPAPHASGAGAAGYVPVAVAPERGNTRPVVPVDGRLHMRMAHATLDALDAAVRSWKARDPAGLRDLERATLVRIGVAMALTDIAQRGDGGAVGEAVRAALDPAVRHTDAPMPDLARWFTATTPPGLSDGPPTPVAGPPADAGRG